MVKGKKKLLKERSLKELRKQLYLSAWMHKIMSETQKGLYVLCEMTILRGVEILVISVRKKIYGQEDFVKKKKMFYFIRGWREKKANTKFRVLRILPN